MATVFYASWYTPHGKRGCYGDEPNMVRVVRQIVVSRDAASRVMDRIRRLGGGGWVFARRAT